MISSEVIKIKSNPPFVLHRIYSVWLRHFRVYTKNLISNGFPIFLEPLFFLIAIGLGLGKYIVNMEGISYLNYLASAIIVPPAMFTASYECTFGTFIRLEFDKIYDGMLSSSITPEDLILGEILFAGTKGLFFSSCVLLIIIPFNMVTLPFALLAPIGGFLTGLMFASLAMIVTSFVKTINHFNFYFTGFLTPLFFFSGLIFPVKDLPSYISWISYALPLSHSASLVRAVCLGVFNFNLIYDLIYIVIFIIISTFIAVKRLKTRLID